LQAGDELWYLDSGCSRHASGNESLFTEIKRKKHENVTFGNNRVGKVIGIRKIGKNPSKFFDNVYLVEGLKFNHLSISQLCDKGTMSS